MSGIDVQIAVCADALAGIALLCPAVNGHLYSGRMKSVLRIPNHGRDPIKNLAPPSVEVVVSIHPATQWQGRIGDRAGDIVRKAATLPCSAKVFNDVLALLDLRLKLGPCLWCEFRDKLIFVGFYHRVPLGNEAVQSGKPVGFYSVLLGVVTITRKSPRSLLVSGRALGTAICSR
jgi:hypothetical protein